MSFPRRPERHQQMLRKGAALLEALVGLVVLSTAALAVVNAVQQTMHSARQATESEQELERASALLDAVALWSREELDQRLGERRQGPWWLRIDRRATTLYTITLMDSTLQSVMLRTAVYRPTAAGHAPAQ